MLNIVGVRLNGSEKIYDFKNKHEFPLNIGDHVVCKVGTGGTAEGVIEQLKETRNPSSNYKDIVEVEKLNIVQKPLEDSFTYICDIRAWRKQWNGNGGYSNEWSDLVINCLYDTTEAIKIGSIVTYEESKGRVVNLRQLPTNKTTKLKIVQLQKPSSSIFNKIGNLFKK